MTGMPRSENESTKLIGGFLFKTIIIVVNFLVRFNIDNVEIHSQCLFLPISFHLTLKNEHSG